MDTRTLHLLLDVARLGSLAATARHHGIDPTTVSRAVAQAEARIGARLFHRSTRRLTPTEAGARFLRDVAEPAARIEAAMEAARAGTDRVTGRVRLAASVAYGTEVLAPALPALLERHPDLAVDLVLDDAPRDLVGERIDVAVRLAPAPTGDLVSRKLHPVRYRLVAAPGTGRADPEVLAARALVHALPGAPPVWRVRTGAGERDVPLAPRATFTSPLALRAAARAGLGVALLADWLVAGDLAAGRLAVVSEAEATPTGFDAAAWALYPARDHLPARVRATIGWLTARA
ncbi:LysR family transcriptional regulator [Jannaschia sp. Os4]|uniref:LysR family transcriptional regulator n=1 Tax=Jannaschia sp. Os4 TaxID=2807617 RepID=UPI00193A38C1|nr:LysR family transcriptional regulator [Jannaschia sp. Os4]MBM2574863.1 LysR family transcriptional regulator [Jannaschia sp. Os4]